MQEIPQAHQAVDQTHTRAQPAGPTTALLARHAQQQGAHTAHSAPLTAKSGTRAKRSPANLTCVQMAPATTPTKLESPDAEPAVDDKAICVPVKPEAAGDDELSIQSLPQGINVVGCWPCRVSHAHRGLCVRVLSITHVLSVAEVLMQIVGYMDAKHVLQSVSLVNHTFHSLSNGKLPAPVVLPSTRQTLTYATEQRRAQTSCCGRPTSAVSAVRWCTLWRRPRGMPCPAGLRRGRRR
jgi:hypothetical protein